MNRLARTTKVAVTVDSAKRRLSDGENLKKENNNNNQANKDNSNAMESKTFNKNYPVSDNDNENDNEIATVDFINISYGYKRRITLNPNSTVQHIRRFLDERIRLDYMDDFSLAVAQQQFRENLSQQDTNSLDPFNSNRNRRNRRQAHRKSTSSDVSKNSSPRTDELPKNLDELPKVSYEEALESIKAQQTIKVDKRWLVGSFRMLQSLRNHPIMLKSPSKRYKQ